MGLLSYLGEWWKPDVPAQREYAGEGYESLAAQTALQPGWAQAERQWRPYWAGTGGAEMQATVFGTGDAPGALGLGNRAARNTLRNVERWSPGQYGLLDTITGQAQSELENPYALSPAEVREITQASLANPALANLGAQPRDAYLAYSNLGSAAVQRAQQRRQFAQQAMAAENMYRTAPALETRNSLLAGSIGRPAGPSIIDPWNQYQQDLYNTNYNAEAAANIAGMNTAGQLLDY